MARKTKHKERTRERIISSAIQLIRKNGLKKLGVAEVMNEAGLTHGGFYAHFANKDELIAEAVNQMCSDTISQLKKYFEGKDPEQGLKDYINFYLSAKHRDGQIEGCFIPILTGNLPHLSEVSRRRFGEGLGLLIDFLFSFVRNIDESYDEATATSLMSEMVGAVKMAQAVQNPDQSDKIINDTRLGLLNRFGIA
ncbi:MAG: TetR/AcrR family transcriptional regulator [Methyloligellaceae bacterium]